MFGKRKCNCDCLSRDEMLAILTKHQKAQTREAQKASAGSDAFFRALGEGLDKYAAQAFDHHNSMRPDAR